MRFTTFDSPYFARCPKSAVHCCTVVFHMMFVGLNSLQLSAAYRTTRACEIWKLLVHHPPVLFTFSSSQPAHDAEASEKSVAHLRAEHRRRCVLCCRPAIVARVSRVCAVAGPSPPMYYGWASRWRRLAWIVYFRASFVSSTYLLHTSIGFGRSSRQGWLASPRLTAINETITS